MTDIIYKIGPDNTTYLNNENCKGCEYRDGDGICLSPYMTCAKYHKKE